MEYCVEEFKNSLNNLNLSPTSKRLWLKQFHKNPELTCDNYFKKMDLMFAGKAFWELAKEVILRVKHDDEVEEPTPPEPVKDFQYFYRQNNYLWGETHLAIDEYERETGIIV